jgi:predicted DNA-binding WGR domain protein
MKLLKQSKLFFREGNSDKVYEIDLCELPNGECIVNFRYGRRGAALKEGTKTSASVSLEQAEKIFNQIENEKRAKGYQTEQEINIALPDLSVVDPLSKEGKIIQRLQDAIAGKNSFSTEWKTSRVIWKAGELNYKNTLPYILKLAQKGDVVQLYAAIWAIIQFKSSETLPFLKNSALQLKQKDFVKHIAFEGYFQLCQDKTLVDEMKSECFNKLSISLQNILKNTDTTNKLFQYWLDKKEENIHFNELIWVYLLLPFHLEWREEFLSIIIDIPFKSPYFKVVRGIYKIAQLRKDFEILSLLAYQFEKQSPMFERKVSLDQDGYYTNQYISALNSNVNVGKELKSENSRIAFSQFTKYYFQKNSINYLKRLADQKQEKEFIDLAVLYLSNYKEEDYTAAYTYRNDYGLYNYELQSYIFKTIEYPECSKAYLYQSILQINNPKNIVSRNLETSNGQKKEIGNRWYYDAQTVRPFDEKAQNGVRAKNDNSGGNESKNGLFGIIKNLFGKKEEQPKLSNELSVSIPKEENVIPLVSDRCELHPEIWDKYPRAYVDLLLKADLIKIHEFAYNRLSKHADFDKIKFEITFDEIILLLSKSGSIPQELGYDLLIKNQQEFRTNLDLFISLFEVKNKKALSWAIETLKANPTVYLSNSEVITNLLFNDNSDLKHTLNDFFNNVTIVEHLRKEIIEKTIIKLVELSNTPQNSNRAKNTILRLKAITSDELVQLNPKIIELLIQAPLEMNALLAAEIIQLKAQANQEVSFDLCIQFLKHSLVEVRNIGINWFENTSQHTISQNWISILSLIEGRNSEVVSKILVKGQDEFLFQHLTNTWVYIVHALTKTPAFDGSHQFILDQLSYYEEKLEFLEPNYLIQVLFSNYGKVQQKASQWLHKYPRTNEFTMKQIVAITECETATSREWAFQYFTTNIDKIKSEKDKVLVIIDSKWEDTRQFAFQFFSTYFDESNWDTTTLISLVDSVKPDVMHFGKQLMMRYFTNAKGHEYLIALSQHPNEAIQLYVSNLLAEYASNEAEKITALDYYFKSVLLKVNRGRITKNRIITFLETEAFKNQEVARYVNDLFSFMVATSAIQDKSKFILVLSKIQEIYPEMDSCLIQIA